MNKSNSFEFDPVGFVHSKGSERYLLPRQPEQTGGNSLIELAKGRNFEQALEDLVGFDYVWLIFLFHKNDGWRSKVNTPRGGGKRGVFSTRSPHRPNPIGLSCCPLYEVNGRTLLVDSDLMDGTPILDIKPYLPYCDAFPDAAAGWTDEVERPVVHTVHCTSRARSQLDWLMDRGVDLLTLAGETLCKYPLPMRSNRVRELVGGGFELGCKTWRLRYEVDSAQGKVTVFAVLSGYDEATLSGTKTSRWNDVDLHRQFLLHAAEVVADLCSDDEK